MKKVKFVEQMETRECGLACITMILNYYGNGVTLSQLRENFPVPKSGLSFENMIEISETYNLTGDAYKVRKPNYSMIKSGFSKIPIIAQWNDGTHFVVIEKVKRKSMIIFDPAIGKSEISLDSFKEKFTGYLLFFEPTIGFVKKKRRKNIEFFLSHIKKLKKELFIIFLLTICIQLFGVVTPLTIGKVTDNLVSGNFYSNNILLSLMIMMFFLYFFVSLLQGVLIVKLKLVLDFKIMSNYMSHLFSLPINFFEQRSQGDILFRSNSYISIREAISKNFIDFFIDIILIITYGVTLMTISVNLSVFIFFFAVMLILLLIATTPLTMKLTKRNVLQNTKIQNYLSESLSNINDIKSSGLEVDFYTKWEKIFSRFLSSERKNGIWNTFIDSLISASQLILPLIILYMGSGYVLNNELTIGELLAFSSVSGIFIGPIFSLCGNYFEVIQLSTIFQRLMDVLNSEKEQISYKNEKKIDISGEIEFNNVSLRYNKFDDFVLRNLSFKIHKGESVAIIGNSGSGKSTVLKMILGMYSPSEGSIKINGHEIEKLNYLALREQTGTVLQESNLFNKSIIDNIILDTHLKDEKKFDWAISMAEIKKDIVSLPLKENTMLTEMGENFSGGQRQRLLLARALYRSKGLLLLDEATSAVDTEMESKIIDNIIKTKHTKVIVTHDVKSIRLVDKIIVVRDGGIIEIGSHEELSDLKGYYYEMIMKK